MGPRESARSSRRRTRTLEHAWQFRRCYDAGRKLVTKHSVIFVFASPEPDGVRVGVVASRRIGGAVSRNRAKRLLREASRGFAHRLNDRNIWVVLVAKTSILGTKTPQVQDDIEQALTAGGLLDLKSNDRHRE